MVCLHVCVGERARERDQSKQQHWAPQCVWTGEKERMAEGEGGREIGRERERGTQRNSVCVCVGGRGRKRERERERDQCEQQR